MNELYERCYEKLLPVVRRAGENKELLGGSLPSLWSGCQADACFLASLLKNDGRAKARFFVIADYCTYLPYGAAGLRFLTERLTREEKTVGELRAERLQAFLGEDWEELDCKEELVSFLGDDGEQEPDLFAFRGTVTAVCRIYHACEANLGKAGYKDFLDVAERTSDIMQPFARSRAAGESPSVRDALRSVPQLKGLTAKQKKTLLTVTGLE